MASYIFQSHCCPWPMNGIVQPRYGLDILCHRRHVGSFRQYSLDDMICMSASHSLRSCRGDDLVLYHSRSNSRGRHRIQSLWHLCLCLCNRLHSRKSRPCSCSNSCPCCEWNGHSGRRRCVGVKGIRNHLGHGRSIRACHRQRLDIGHCRSCMQP